MKNLVFYIFVKFMKKVLVEQLEDAEDLEAYRARRLEPTISLARVLASRKGKKKK